MKKITLFAALAALVFVSCNKDETSLIKMSNHTITASMETDNPETRTAFNQDGALYWIAGDDIAVLSTNGSFTKYTLTDGKGTADATFTAEARIGSNSTYALHPYSEGHKYEDSELTFNMPVEYKYTEQSDDYGTAPMIAVTEEVDASSYSFKHLGGAFCFTLNRLPAGVNYFKFEADEQITGDFTIKEVDGHQVISLPEAEATADEAYAVKITFPAEETVTDKRFFIPLPEGTIDGFRISIGTSEGETWSYTSTKSNTIARTELVAMPAVTLNATVDGTVATEVSTTEQLKSAFTNGGKYILTTGLTLTEQLTFNNIDKPLTIDLGNNTLTLGTSTYGIVNKAGTLTIKNGTISSSNSYAALSNYYSSTNAANIETVLDNVNVTASNYAVYNKGVWEDGKTIQNYKDTEAAVKFTINGGSITSSTSATDANWYAVFATDYSHTTISGTTITGTNAAGGIGLNCAQATLTNVTINGGTAGTAHDVWVRTGILTTSNTTYDNYLYSASGDYGYTEVNGKFYGPTANQAFDTLEAVQNANSSSN